VNKTNRTIAPAQRFPVLLNIDSTDAEKANNIITKMTDEYAVSDEKESDKERNSDSDSRRGYLLCGKSLHESNRPWILSEYITFALKK